MIHASAVTDFCPLPFEPELAVDAFVHPMGAVIGHVFLGRRVFVAPFAAVRGDEGQPIFVGDDSNVQDGVIIHALETEKNGRALPANRVQVAGGAWAVHIGHRVSLAHQAQIHGPACIGEDTFVGMQSLVFRSRVGSGCVIEPGCILMGVQVPDKRYVPAGTVVRDQTAADALPEITADYPLRDLNAGVVHVNTSLAVGYARRELPAMETAPRNTREVWPQH